MEGRERLLVAYLLRGSSANEVDAFRRICQSTEIDRIAPHITLVPPVNVPAGMVDEIGASIESAVGSCPPIELALQGLGVFPPGQRVLYLPVTGALDELVSLRQRCAVSALRTVDRHPFVAHVTIKSHADDELFGRLLPLFANYALPITVDRVTILRVDPTTRDRAWVPIDEVVLGAELRIGRGGREITLSRAAMISGADREFFTSNREESALNSMFHPDGRREVVVVRARIDGTLVGLAVLELHGTFGLVHEFLVAKASRRQGVGRAILTALDRSASELEIVELVAPVEKTSEGFFIGVGFELSGARFGEPGYLRATRPLGN